MSYVLLTRLHSNLLDFAVAVESTVVSVMDEMEHHSVVVLGYLSIALRQLMPDFFVAASRSGCQSAAEF